MIKRVETMFDLLRADGTLLGTVSVTVAAEDEVTASVLAEARRATNEALGALIERQSEEEARRAAVRAKLHTSRRAS